MSSNPRARKSPARDAWRDELWESDLPAGSKLIGLAFANHVQVDSDPLAQSVFVVHHRLVTLTSLATNSVTKYRARLIDEGWLTLTEEPSGRRTARYALTIPVATYETQIAVVERPLSRKTYAVESQNSARRVATVATDYQDSGDSGNTGVGLSSHLRPVPEISPGGKFDDPYFNQPTERPPAEAAEAFRALAIIAADPVEPNLCGHGIVRTRLGDGSPACDRGCE